MPLKVFVDSDVIISSLISSTGAASLLLNQMDQLKRLVSNISVKELEKVTERLNLDQEKLKNLIQEKFSIIQIKEPVKTIKARFAMYVFDIDDAHIVAGARKSNAQFLISYNTKHFKADKLKEDFNIILTTPANFLQYLRSI